MAGTTATRAPTAMALHRRARAPASLGTAHPPLASCLLLCSCHGPHHACPLPSPPRTSRGSFGKRWGLQCSLATVQPGRAARLRSGCPPWPAGSRAALPPLTWLPTPRNLLEAGALFATHTVPTATSSPVQTLLRDPEAPCRVTILVPTRLESTLSHCGHARRSLFPHSVPQGTPIRSLTRIPGPQLRA